MYRSNRGVVRIAVKSLSVDRSLLIQLLTVLVAWRSEKLKNENALKTILFFSLL